MSTIDSRSYHRNMRRALKRKRESMWNELLAAFHLLGGIPLAYDTYKRTMGEADDIFSMEPACYTLTPRRALPDTKNLIMAGHEFIQAQWFLKPLKRRNIELARYHCEHVSAVKAWPHKPVDKMLSEQPGKDIRLPIDIWGFPGGQCFPVLQNKPKVPVLTYLGIGGLSTWLEPAQCRYFAPIEHATLGRLMLDASPKGDAEYGLRGAPSEINSIALLWARFIGSGGRAKLTSNDQAEFMRPDLFTSIGTMGHELVSCRQQPDKPLGQAEFEAIDNYVTKRGNGMILPDLVDANSVGLLNTLKIIAKHPDLVKVGIRLDSGELGEQAVLYIGGLKYVIRVVGRTIVVENEMTHNSIKVLREFVETHAGVDPDILFPGEGGYWWFVHRDTISMAFKRSATGEFGNVKFSNSPGKESLPGYLRVYAVGRTMIIADAREGVLGEPLFVPIVLQGRYVYNESIHEQAARADRTWDQYDDVVLSPMVASTLKHYQEMREREIEAAQPELREVLRQIDLGRIADGLPALYGSAA